MTWNEIEMTDPQGDRMVPLRCELCGEQIGLRSPGPIPDNVVPRCYACAATEEAEAITAASSRSCPETGETGDAT